jgi:hypothetical protein
LAVATDPLLNRTRSDGWHRNSEYRPSHLGCQAKIKNRFTKHKTREGPAKTKAKKLTSIPRQLHKLLESRAFKWMNAGLR